MMRVGPILAGFGLGLFAVSTAEAQVSSGQTLGLYVGIGGGWSHVMPFSERDSYASPEPSARRPLAARNRQGSWRGREHPS